MRHEYVLNPCTLRWRTLARSEFVKRMVQRDFVREEKDITCGIMKAAVQLRTRRSAAALI